jgi:hypothetical protein
MIENVLLISEVVIIGYVFILSNKSLKRLCRIEEKIYGKKI